MAAELNCNETPALVCDSCHITFAGVSRLFWFSAVLMLCFSFADGSVFWTPPLEDIIVFCFQLFVEILFTFTCQ